MDPQRNTKIVDVEGVEHDYMLTLFPFDLGLSLAVDVGEVIGLPIAELITGADLNTTGGDGTPKIEWTTLAKGIVSALAKLKGDAGYSLVCRLLSRCRRSTIDAQGRHQWVELSDRARLNVIYQGNYGEALRACAWVVRENWIPLSLGSGSMIDLLGSLMSSGESATPTPNPATQAVG